MQQGAYSAREQICRTVFGRSDEPVVAAVAAYLAALKLLTAAAGLDMGTPANGGEVGRVH